MLFTIFLLTFRLAILWGKLLVKRLEISNFNLNGPYGIP